LLLLFVYLCIFYFDVFSLRGLIQNLAAGDMILGQMSGALAYLWCVPHFIAVDLIFCVCQHPLNVADF